MQYYPVFLDLKEKHVLVVGGGRIAQDKIEKLLSAGARIEIVSPQINEYLTRLVETGAVGYCCKEFEESDLDGKFLVISATDKKEVNENVSRLAEIRSILCNVVDQPALCNFIVPALVTRGDLQIAISTGGKSPTIAQKAKKEIENLIGDEYACLLEIAAAFRQKVQHRFSDYTTRREMMRKFVESEVLDLIYAHRTDEIDEVTEKILNEYDQKQ
jgi:precorrin-2 dehydrogenase / sirohydrochlorin ferrochelatase